MNTPTIPGADVSRASDGYRPVYVHIRAGRVVRAGLPRRTTRSGRTRRARPPVRSRPYADQPTPLYAGCDVVLYLDPSLRLRGASALHAATVYALALEHSRHDPRAVHVIGATPELREAVARVIVAAFPLVDVTASATMAQKTRAEPLDIPRITPARVEGREAQRDVDAPALVRITRVAALGVVARQSSVPLYPGCDVDLHLELKLRGAPLRDVSMAYALALEHSRHDPRSVRVDGNAELRRLVAVVLATAFPECETTYVVRRSTGVLAARLVPAAHAVDIDAGSG